MVEGIVKALTRTTVLWLSPLRLIEVFAMAMLDHAPGTAVIWHD
jgi:hypothetical protein